MSYLQWYYYKFLPSLVYAWSLYTQFLSHYFSFNKLLSTLFSPWKRQDSSHSALHSDNLLESLSLNLVSRGLGFFVRLTTIIVGLFSYLILILILSLITTATIIFFPITIPLYIHWNDSHIIRAHRSWDENINNISRSSWFHFLCKRLNLDEGAVIKVLLQQELTIPKEFSRVLPDHIDEFFLWLLEYHQPFAKLLAQIEVKADDVKQLSRWYDYVIEQKISFSLLNYQYLMSIKAIGSSWSYGYTPHLDAFCEDISKHDWRSTVCIGREKEIQFLETSLSQPKHNQVLIYGDSGVGKQTLIYGLLKKIQWHQTEKMNHKRILWFDPEHFFDQKSDHRRSVLFESVLNEASNAGNIILVIDNIDQLIGAAETENFSAESIIKNTTQNTNLPIIALSSKTTYESDLVKKSELNQIFEARELKELDNLSVAEICYLQALQYERLYNTYFSYKTLQAIPDLTDTYMTYEPQPTKSIKVVELIASHAKEQNITFIQEQHVNQILSEHTNIKISPVTKNSAQEIIGIETKIKEHVFGQTEAITAIAKALRRNVSLINDPTKPIASFLFLGPTGVGKTATALALAEAFFSDTDLIRFDMAEFQAQKSISRLLGTETSIGLLAEKIRSKPNTVLLLDEFEKASTKIHNLFLTILDEGYFVSGDGTKIDCTNLIIIATSNAEAETIQSVSIDGEITTENQEMLFEKLTANQHFSPELLNRFNKVIFFKSLTNEVLLKAIELKLSNLASFLQEQKNLEITWDNNLAVYILEHGYSKKFGVRSLEHYIEDQVEDYIAKQVLNQPEIKQIHIQTDNLTS